ncbi:MAG: hypothetical protein Q9159_004197 [Coniocarpon cinnabarinum]
MAKDKSETPAERAARKAAKKATKTADASVEVLHQKVEGDGVEKQKKHKKEKHREKRKAREEALVKEAANGAVEAAEEEKTKAGQEMEGVEESRQVDGVGVVDTKPVKQRPVGKLVKFADPLADEKGAKRLLKGVERSAQAKTLKRGVKEVNKAIKYASTKFASPPEAICIIAGDISPMDVVSHLPVFCEQHFIPYVFVPSRDRLGQAGLTTRPTSVVLVLRETKNMSEEEKGTWQDEYQSMCKAVEKTPRRQPII